ncbi:hypothetical protein PAT3040_00020 [Paenibacillus agaridevorans]|uniref:YhfM-like domain-containing protein n=1 Tax=Paenibacillus agaridevorans TaxID=171404 RepID=A0A2R5EG64_9BACL|nr:DUF4362 domain-containing protein [Paenibacillus agaridevorans]GBG05540.1 hypothetical protein PAT3040_00020 [Paenibacillus agaridevorans]
MRRIKYMMFLIVSIMFVSIVSAGCSGKSSGTPPGEPGGAQVDRVVVSRSIEFARVNDKPYGIFDGKKEIEAFAKAIQTGDKMRGQLDIDFPDYDVVIDRNGKRKQIHLWLDQRSNRGMFTYVSDTGTGYTLTEKSTKELVDLIWGIGYDSDKAAENGDVVAELSGGVRNAEHWLSFVDHVERGELADIQVVYYTKEGDPIFRNLIHNGDSLRLRYDNTHDAYGTPVDRTDFCEGIEAQETEQGTVYTLSGCGDSETGFELVLPGSGGGD